MARTLARPVALGVIRDRDEIFVFEGHDHPKHETFCRPLGGTIEFGERAVDAVRRELAEEIDVTVTRAELLGVFENIFTYQGQPGHEIDFVFDVTVSDLARLRDGTVAAYEADGSAITCLWKSLADFRDGARLYPEGLLPLPRQGRTLAPIAGGDEHGDGGDRRGLGPQDPLPERRDHGVVTAGGLDLIAGEAALGADDERDVAVASRVEQGRSAGFLPTDDDPAIEPHEERTPRDGLVDARHRATVRGLGGLARDLLPAQVLGCRELANDRPRRRERHEAGHAQLGRGLDDLFAPVALQDRHAEREAERELARDRPARDDLAGDLRRRDGLQLHFVLDQVGHEDHALARLQPQDRRDLPGLVAGQKGALSGRGVHEEAVHPDVLAGQLERDPVPLVVP